MAALCTQLLLLSVVLVVGSSGNPATPSPDHVEPTWNCPEVAVQANGSVEQAIGEWFVLELEGSPPAKPRDACSVLSLKGLARDEGNGSSSVVLSIHLPRNFSDDRGYDRFRQDVHFLTDKPQEFVSGDLNSVWRVHFLSDDRQLLVLAACNVRRPDRVYWLTMGATVDVDVAGAGAGTGGRAANSTVVRRDDNLCKELAQLRPPTNNL